MLDGRRAAPRKGELHVERDAVAVVEPAHLRKNIVVRKINPETGRQLRIATDVGSIGIELALSPLIGFLGGRFLDRTLGTDPWLMYVGLGLGLAAGVRAVWKVMKRTKRVLEAKPETAANAEERGS